jgi:hypothetical protein
MTVRDVPCADWTTVDAVKACGCPDLDDAVVQAAIEVASSVLYNWSKRRFPGICEDTVRPCARRSALPGWSLHGLSQAWGYSGAGTWLPEWGTCSCNTEASCSCCGIPSVRLGGWPVVEVLEVLVDGVALAPGDYRLDNDTSLVRIDGQPWPCCQNMELADTEPGTWSVTYTYGREPDPGGVLAANLYACEVAKLCGGGECKLPARVQTITRQGMSAGFIDVDALVQLGALGIPFVDQWLLGLERAKQGRGLVIASPDIGRRVRRTGA